ncbi:AhpD-like protein [Aspergillus ambiguus]|uniref:AhpD-like protein n=1 Tax=Aspergillus ambiguus TaxID=176160 RepID=UPI003CCE4A90
MSPPAKKIKWKKGLKFPSLEEGRAALIQHTIDQQQSFRVVKSDHKRFFTRCLSGPECPYQVSLYVRRDTVNAQVNHYKPHTCKPETHVGWVPPESGASHKQMEVNGVQLEANPQNEPVNGAPNDIESNVKIDETPGQGAAVPEKGTVSEASKAIESLQIAEETAAVEDPITSWDQAVAAEEASTPMVNVKDKKKSKKQKKKKKSKTKKDQKAQKSKETQPKTPEEPPTGAREPEYNAVYDKGLQTRREVLGNAHVDHSLAANSNAFSRPMQEVVTEWAWGNVWNREGLNRQQRSLLNIGLLTALNRTPELAVHVRGAINNGLSELEIREAIIHSTVYCGAPAGMEATRTAEKVLREMEENGEHERVLK